MKYRKGQLYFIKNNSFFGKGISYYNLRTFGRSDCTHIGIITNVNSLDNKVEIAEATSKGFIFNEYDSRKLNRQILEGKVHIGEVNEELKNVREICKKYEGIRYGYLDILGIGLSGLIGWKVLGITGKNAIICSEAVSRVIYDCTKKIDFAKEYNIKFDAITPEHIYLSKQVKIKR